MKKQADPDSINMTPMIDMVFQLIIFFVCSIDMANKNFDKNIKLAEAPNAPELKTPATGTVYINLTKDGEVKLGQMVVTGDQLRSFMLATVRRYGNNFPVVIRAAQTTPHKYVKSVMNILANCKVIKISLHAETTHH